MRGKSKCGSTLTSASSAILRELPDCRSLSALMIARTSSVTRFTRASGASCASAAAGTKAARNMRILRSMGSSLDAGLVRPERASGGSGLLPGLFLGLAEQELADELLQHHGRLADLDAVARGEHLLVPARFQPDVGLAEQARGEDRRGRVLGELVALVERERDTRLVALVVEVDLVYAAHEHAGAAHRAAHLEAADVVEAHLDGVGLRGALGAEVADLEGEDQQRGETRRHEGAEPQVYRRSFHRLCLGCQSSPRSMTAVSIRSRARITRAEVTTVRVVARETPSAVGGAS